MITAKWVLVAGIIAGILAGCFYALKQARDSGYNEAVSEYTAKQLIAEQAARATEQKLNKQIEDAEHAGNLREQANKKLSGDLAVVSRKLRDTTTTMRSKLSTDSIDAIRTTADAALTVFGECEERYTAMAENATGHASDVLTLTQAWPTLLSNEPS